MAARYWVGGTANWDATAGTKWALTNGGAGGQAVPTVSDDVYFTAASGASVVTIAATANCLTLTTTGFTGTIAGSSQILNIRGNCVIGVATTWNFTGTMDFSTAGGVTWNITTNGRTIKGPITGTNTGSLSIVKLLDNLTSNNSITFTNNTSYIQFDTNTKNLTCVNVQAGTIKLLTGTYNFSGTITSASVLSSGGTITCAGMTVTTLNNASGAGSIASSATLTIATYSNAGTQVITLTGAANLVLTFASTFYTVNLNGTAHTIGGSGVVITFGTLTRNGTNTQTDSLTLSGAITVTGTLTVAGFSKDALLTLNSSLAGTRRTLTAAVVVLSNLYTKDIGGAGAAAPFAAIGTSLINLGNCAGITFIGGEIISAVAKIGVKRYWIGGTGTWSQTSHWSATSGGAGGASVPTQYDDVYFDDNSFSVDGQIVTIGAIVSVNNFSDTVTNYIHTVPSSTSYSMYIYGSAVFSAKQTMTSNSSNGIYFASVYPLNQTVACNGATINCKLSFGGSTSCVTTWTMLSDVVVSNNAVIGLYYGILDFNDFDVTAASLLSTGTNAARRIKLGNGTITLYHNATPITFTSSLNLDAEGSTVYSTRLEGDYGLYERVIDAAGKTFNHLIISEEPTGASGGAKFPSNIICDILELYGNSYYSGDNGDTPAYISAMTISDGITVKANNLVVGAGTPIYGEGGGPDQRGILEVLESYDFQGDVLVYHVRAEGIIPFKVAGLIEILSGFPTSGAENWEYYWDNPASVFIQDEISYASVASENGLLSMGIRKGAGDNPYSDAETKLVGSEIGTYTFGGPTSLWGYENTDFIGTDNHLLANLGIKIHPDGYTEKYQRYSGFGFELPNVVLINGISVTVRAQYVDGIIKIYWISVNVFVTPSKELEVRVGSLCFATDGRKYLNDTLGMGSYEAHEQGTGTVVIYDGLGRWISVNSGHIIAA